MKSVYSGSHIAQQSTSVKKINIATDKAAKAQEATDKFNNAWKMELPDLKAQGKGLIDIMTAYHKGTTAVTNYELDAQKNLTKGIGQIAEAFLVEPAKEAVKQDRASGNLFWAQNGSQLDEIYKLESIQTALTEGRKTKNLVAEALTKATGNGDAASEFLALGHFGHITLKQAQLQAKGDNADANFAEYVDSLKANNTILRQGGVGPNGEDLSFSVDEFNQLTTDQKDWIYDQFIAKELTDGYNGLDDASNHKYLGTPLNNWRKKHAANANLAGRTERSYKALELIDQESNTEIRSAVQTGDSTLAEKLLLDRFALQKPYLDQLQRDGQLPRGMTSGSYFIKKFQEYGNNLIKNSNSQDVEEIGEILKRVVNTKQYLTESVYDPNLDKWVEKKINVLPFGDHLGVNQKINASHWDSKVIARQDEIYTEKQTGYEVAANNMKLTALADYEKYVQTGGKEGKPYPSPTEREEIVEAYRKAHPGASGNPKVEQAIKAFLNPAFTVKDKAGSITKVENNWVTQGRIQTVSSVTGVDSEVKNLNDRTRSITYRSTGWGQGSDKDEMANLKKEALKIFNDGNPINANDLFHGWKGERVQLAKQQEREVMLHAQDLAIAHWTATGGENGGVWLPDSHFYKEAMAIKRAEFEAAKLDTTGTKRLSLKGDNFQGANVLASRRFSAEVVDYAPQIDNIRELVTRGGTLSAQKLNLVGEHPELLEVGPNGEIKTATAYMAQLLGVTPYKFIQDQLKIQGDPGAGQTYSEANSLEKVFNGFSGDLTKLSMINGSGKLSQLEVNKRLNKNGVFLTSKAMNQAFNKFAVVRFGSRTDSEGKHIGWGYRQVIPERNQAAYEAALAQSNEWQAARAYGLAMGLSEEDVNGFLEDLRRQGITNQWFRNPVRPVPVSSMKYKEQGQYNIQQIEPEYTTNE